MISNVPGGYETILRIGPTAKQPRWRRVKLVSNQTLAGLKILLFLPYLSL